jgi:hypothetical protein
VDLRVVLDRVPKFYLSSILNIKDERFHIFHHTQRFGRDLNELNLSRGVECMSKYDESCFKMN